MTKQEIKKEIEKIESGVEIENSVIKFLYNAIQIPKVQARYTADQMTDNVSDAIMLLGNMGRGERND